MNQPKVGDVWQGEDDQGNPIFRTVTAVFPPVSDDTRSLDWQISLGGDGPVHLGWWYGQGWSEVES